MKPNWFLIANATHARILQQETGAPLIALEILHHPDSRKHTAELGDDKAGRDMGGSTFGGAAFEPRADAHRKEHLRFAHEVATHLETAAREGRYGSLVVFASNPFMGELKQALGAETLRLLEGMHPVDLTGIAVNELDKRIPELHKAPAH